MDELTVQCGWRGCGRARTAPCRIGMARTTPNRDARHTQHRAKEAWDTHVPYVLIGCAAVQIRHLAFVDR